MTKAETRARAMAKLLDETGNFNVEVKVEEREPTLLDSGTVLFGPSVIVHVHAGGKRIFDDTYSFSFISYLPAEGCRASTKFLGGLRIRSFARSRRDRFRRLSLKGTRFAIGCEVDSALYAAEHASKEA